MDEFEQHLGDKMPLSAQEQLREGIRGMKQERRRRDQVLEGLRAFAEAIMRVFKRQARETRDFGKNRFDL